MLSEKNMERFKKVRMERFCNMRMMHVVKEEWKSFKRCG